MNKYKQVNLKHGGKLFYVKNNISKSTVIEIAFACGSRSEEISGLAHFVEHMFFSGTKTKTREEISKKYFDFIGSNAYTDSREIVFTAQIFTKEFTEYVKTVASMITESTFKQSEVDKECNVIKQEIAGVKDKQSKLSTEFNFYNVSNLKCFEGYGTVGSEESVSTIKSSDIKKFVKKYFVANNVKIYVSTQLSFNKVKQIIAQELISKLSVNEKFKPLPKFYVYNKNKNFVCLKNMSIGKNYISINFGNSHNLYDLKYLVTKELVFHMLNDISTGICKPLRLEKSLVYWANVYTMLSNDKESVVTFNTECDTQNVNKTIQTFAEYLNEVYNNGFTKEQFEQAKRMKKYKADTKVPAVYRLIDKLAGLDMYGRVISKDLDKLRKSVTLEDCNNLFKEMFATKDVSMSVYGEIPKKELLTLKQFNKLFMR